MINFYSYAERYVSNQMKKAGLQKKEIRTQDFVVDYWDSATKKPCIFLLNGFGANSEFQWFKQVSLLQNKYRVVVVNLLYFGKSFPKSGTCY